MHDSASEVFGGTDIDRKRLLLSALQRLGAPATAAQLQRALAKHELWQVSDVRVLLEELVAEGAVHAWGRRFTLHDPEAVIIDALKRGPLTQAELGRRLAEVAPGLATTAELRRCLRALCRRGRVKQHPKLGKAAQRYALHGPELTPFIRPAARALRIAQRQLERSGVTLSNLIQVLCRELGEVLPGEASSAQQLDVADAKPPAQHAQEHAQERRQTAPEVPLALRDPEASRHEPRADVVAHITAPRSRNETWPDSPDALRSIHASDESAIVTALRALVGEDYTGRRVPVRALRDACQLDAQRFERAVIALAGTGFLALENAGLLDGEARIAIGAGAALR